VEEIKTGFSNTCMSKQRYNMHILSEILNVLIYFKMCMEHSARYNVHMTIHKTNKHTHNQKSN
jgi:hypothetical protein